MTLSPTSRLLLRNTARINHRAATRSSSTRTSSTPAPYQTKPDSLTSSQPPGKAKPNFKQLERRWIAIMVGTPVAIMSGWTLYKREVLGEHSKKLVEREEGDEGAVIGGGQKERGKKASIF